MVINNFKLPNQFFQFKQFTIHQDKCAMKVTTDSCLFGSLFQVEDSKNVLDIGTGTGLLSLMYAQKNPAAKIDAIELDEAAAKQAEDNFKSSPWSENIQTICADAKTYLFTGKYDTIICNPPFYENELSSDDIRKNQAHHDEGLRLKDVFQLIQNNLSPGGKFYLLLPYKRNNELKNLLSDFDFGLEKIIFFRQTPAHLYFRNVLVGCLHPVADDEIKIQELIIKDEHNNYTPAFVSLLKDYYLHL